MKRIKNVLFYLCSFLLPIFILVIVSGVNNNFPLGENALIAYDGSLQHPGFLAYFKNVLLGNASLFYSLKGALGYNFFATFIYYLISPFNIFSIFFNENHLVIFYSIIFYIKIGSSSVTMLMLLNYLKRRKMNILFALCYALMAYNLVYFSNTMWIDSIIMCPLVVLGIEKLIKEEKKILYVVSLSLSIIFNFYIGYMITIFSILYFIYKTFTYKTNKKIIKHFIILTLLSGFITAFVLLPVFFELLNGKVALYSDSRQTDYFSFSLDFINSFYRSSIGSFNVRDISNGPPNIYCSLFIIILVFLFFFNKEFSRKEKIVTISIILFYLLSFSFNLIDYAWHFFQKPIWFPNRYSFTFSLFLILIAFKSFNNIKHVKINKDLIFSFILLVMLYFISFILNKTYLDKVTLMFSLFSILLLFQYLIIFILNKEDKFTFLIILFLILELGINSYYTLKNINFNNSTNYKIVESVSSNKDLNIIKKRENGFYRIEFNSTPIHNNGALFNYNGINYFNSLRNGNVMNFLENKIGMKVIDDARITYNSTNPLINTLFGIKYFEGNDNEFYYKKISNNNKNLYYNDLTLPLFFLSDFNEYELLNKDYFNNLEKIYNSFINKEINFVTNLSTKLENIKENKKDYIRTDNKGFVTYKITLPEKGWLVFNSIEDFRYFKPSIYKNGEKMKIDYNNSTSLFFDKNDEVEIKYNITYEKIKKEILDVKYINYNEFNKIIKTINDNKGNLINYKKDNNLKVKVYAKKDTKLVSMIPYEYGWYVYVDGKKVKKDKVYNTFMSVNLNKGMHVIEYKFIPRGLILGVIISIISLLITIVYIYKNKVNKS